MSAPKNASPAERAAQEQRGAAAAAKIALVTGASDGIGKETAAALARLGMAVLLHGRDAGRTEAAAAALRAAVPGARVAVVLGDLAVLAQVRALAEAVSAECAELCLDGAPRLDVLVNNAGVFLHQRSHTAEGVEMTLAVNHLGHFLLTHLLLPLLSASADGRIINVSSIAHSRGHLDLTELGGPRPASAPPFEGYAAYAAAKLANVLFTCELARRLPGAGYPHISVNALHPGVIGTKLLRAGFGASGGSLAEGAALSVKLASADGLRGVSGRYFSGGRESASAPQSHDREAQRALYERSAQIVGVPSLPPA